jgi:hypothetical protein
MRTRDDLSKEVEMNPNDPGQSRYGYSAPNPAMSAPMKSRKRENTPDSLPPDLRDHIEELEEWASANKKEALQDTVAFWSLKVPAILAAASAGIWGHFELTAVSIVAGALASVCVIVDGIHPRGMLRNTHLRAFHDLRILTSRMMMEWRSRSTMAKDQNTARRIIREAEAERVRIAACIRDAETALKPEAKV